MTASCRRSAPAATFGALATRLPAIELRENRRQAAAGSARRSRCCATGEPTVRVRRYEARGRVVAGEDADEVRRRLVADWWGAGDPDGAVMIAHRRRDVADLNGRAHALMRAAGALGGDELAVGEVASRSVIVWCCGGTTGGSAS